MSCTPTPTATLYRVAATQSPSTSFSQSVADTGAQAVTVVQSCVASGTIGGSSVGCISSIPVTQVNTAGGGAQTVQVPIVVNVPVTQSQPTQTLFAPCTGGGTTSTSQTTPTSTPLTTSILVASTLPPSTVVEVSSTTLADGSVVQTAVTVVTTLPPTSVYVPTTTLASATLQSNGNGSQGSGTNVAPIVGGVLGGFLGLVVIVGSLWWLCRRRRSWDDIFEKEDLQNDDAWAPTTTARRQHRSFDSGAAPRPYQYGLVGHVIPPAAVGESLRLSQYGSVSEYSGAHSRQTSFSATPLLQGTGTASSRPSTSGSVLTVQTQPGSRVRSPVTSPGMGPRSLSVASHSGSSAPMLDGQTPALLGNWVPNTDDLAVLEPLNRTGSPVPSAERRILQIINDGPPSPTDTVVRISSDPSAGVVMHTDGGPATESDANPPAYSR